jgi:predicted phosphodiesterase
VGDTVLGVMSDLHVGASSVTGWHNRLVSLDAADYVAPTIAALRSARPDLVLVLGDLTQDGTDEQLAEARVWLDKLECPWLACKGNHEQRSLESRRRFERVLSPHAPVGLTSAALLPVGLDALVLDAAWVVGDRQVALDRPAVVAPPLRMRLLDSGWPDSSPDSDPDQRRVLLVLSHFPLVDQRARITAVGGKNAGTLDDGPGLLTALARRYQSVLCFAGHQHFHHIELGSNWLHVTTASLAEYPAEYRILRLGVASRTVTVSTLCAVAPALVAAGLAGSGWVAGAPEDRTLTWQW